MIFLVKTTYMLSLILSAMTLMWQCLDANVCKMSTAEPDTSKRVATVPPRPPTPTPPVNTGESSGSLPTPPVNLGGAQTDYQREEAQLKYAISKIHKLLSLHTINVIFVEIVGTNLK